MSRPIKIILSISAVIIMVWCSFATVLLVIGFVFPSQAANNAASSTAFSLTAVTEGMMPETSGDRATVARIIDGDTIEVGINGVSYRLRYIGMDTPERGQPFFEEATEANRQLVEGQTVILVKDVSETDRYGRLLRYIYLQDGTFVNAELVKRGFAQVATFPPDVAHQALFITLERQAREAGRGLWAQPEPPNTSESSRFPQICDPAYPTVCISPPPPNLNCGDVPHRNFEALPADPHGFDRDNDGVGCES
ncbi:MAG: thermonuclease family protein [Anaerolineae bacterium]|nr:thermonuclease family protein [Anaerolineae bacterium]